MCCGKRGHTSGRWLGEGAGWILALSAPKPGVWAHSVAQASDLFLDGLLGPAKAESGDRKASGAVWTELCLPKRCRSSNCQHL